MSTLQSYNWNGQGAYETTDSYCRLIIAVPANETSVGLLTIGKTVEELEITLDVGDNSNVTLSVMQQGANNIVLKQQSKVGAGATLQVHNITLGSGAVEQAIENELTGASASSSVDWIFYAKEKQQYKLSARNIFNAREGSGEMTMKGIAQDSAYIECDGMIDIGLDGGGTDTYLTEDVLMLDSTAKVDAIPGLEIKTNDVKASHSATVSQVTEADLFYFGARGINPALSRQMYIEGFLGDLVQRLPEENRQQVLEAIHAKYMSQTHRE